MLGKLSSEFLLYTQRCKFIIELNSFNALRRSVKRQYGKSFALHTEINGSIADEELRDIFKFRDTKISNWIIEVLIIS